MKLKDYLRKKVKIKNDEGKIFVGLVVDELFPEETASNEEGIILECRNKDLIEFVPSHIRSIEEILTI